MTLGPISFRSCVFVGFLVYLGVFVDFTNTICGFCVIFLDFLGRGSKTVSLIYDTWANLLSIMCICGFFGVFWCICGFYKYDLWILCDFFSGFPGLG